MTKEKNRSDDVPPLRALMIGEGLDFMRTVVWAVVSDWLVWQVDEVSYLQLEEVIFRSFETHVAGEDGWSHGASNSATRNSLCQRASFPQRGDLFDGVQSLHLFWRSPMSSLQRFWFEDQGQDIAEYAVMLAVILVLVVGTIRLVGSNANNVFSNVASSIQ